MKQSFLMLSLFFALTANAAVGEFRVGAAAVVITPPDGTPMAGYYRKRLSEGTLDDLYSKAVVFERDGVKAALVVCDILTLPRHVIETARKLIEQQTGIRGEAVMIAATHSHTSPVVSGENTRDKLDGGDTEPALKFTENLPKLIAQSVVEANRKLALARGSATIAHEDGVSFNRRFWMRDGSVSWNPPKLDKNIIRPAGPIDAEVGFLYFDSPEARPITSVVNFALHSDTTGGQKFSADYMGHLSRLMAEYKGREMMTLFALGACGNINHRDIAWADNQKGVAESFRIASSLAGAINRSWVKLQPIDASKIQIRSEIVKLPTAPINDEDIAKANEVLKRLTDPQNDFHRTGKSLSGFGHRRPKKPPAGSRSPGHRAWQRRGVCFLARRSLCRTRHFDQKSFAVQTHDHRRTGKRFDWLHSEQVGLPRRPIRSHKRTLRRRIG
ncbi:MAG: hypothetical protein ACKVZH_04180 [Blastocatellia bacterium]